MRFFAVAAGGAVAALSSTAGAVLRTAVVLALLSMHLGIALTMRLNAIGIIAWSCALGSAEHSVRDAQVKQFIINM